MIDIHTHILPLADDGICSFEDAVAILKAAKQDGVDSIILTPHSVFEFYLNNKVILNTMFQKFKLKLEGINDLPELYLGSEIAVDEELLQKLESNSLSTMADSNYILIEFPFKGNVKKLIQIVLSLKDKGYKVILAHPERYLHRNPIFYELYEGGLMLQINASSIFGEYGKRAQKIAIELLNKDMVSFVASDSHFLDSIFFLKKAYNKIEADYGKDRAELLFNKNPLRVINNET